MKYLALYIALLLFLAIVLSGCGSTPYLELGVGHDFNEMNLTADGEPYSLACGVATGEIGGEWDNGMSLAYYHQSCVNWDRYSDKRVDMIVLKKKWGGIQ